GTDGIWECQVDDSLGERPLRLRARQIVNATGPWADKLPHSQVRLRATKGVHIVLHRERIPVPDTVVMTEGKRILFAIPWGERVILGTTDTDYTGPVAAVKTEPEDIAYLLKVANQFFPSARLGTKDVISAWAGLRPLIADPNGKPSDISRSHQIRNPEPGWWDVAGGKLTTYRLMAEQTVDKVIVSLKAAGALEREPRACATAREPLLPQSETDGVSGILPPEVTRRAVEHYCTAEWAIHLDDIMVRRAGWHYYSPDAASIAEKAAEWMGEFLGWPAETRAAELRRYLKTTGLRDTPPAPLDNAKTLIAR
ncbi:MAG TPA: FAD-dependent oxidoreductase, partial [Verrucomicrobiae bacterium]|nr:FAD-dependent oxidoreductase [Verrucomicrobiae bacterium]